MKNTSTQIKKAFPGGYQPRVRAEHEALPNTIDILRQPVHKSEQWVSVRPGADDHKRVESRMT